MLWCCEPCNCSKLRYTLLASNLSHHITSSHTPQSEKPRFEFRPYHTFAQLIAVTALLSHHGQMFVLFKVWCATQTSKWLVTSHLLNKLMKLKIWLVLKERDWSKTLFSELSEAEEGESRSTQLGQFERMINIKKIQLQHCLLSFVFHLCEKHGRGQGRAEDIIRKYGVGGRRACSSIGML